MPRPRGHPEAIVRPKAGERVFDVDRITPSAALSEYVEYYWLVRWRVPDVHRQQVVPQPRIHVAAEEGRLLVHGVSRRPFFRTLTGTGHVLGAAFHAGGFRPLFKANVGSIAGTVQPAEHVLGVDDRAAAAMILGSTDTARSDAPGSDASQPGQAQMVSALEQYLLLTRPEPDATAREVTALVALAERRSAITRSEQLAAHAGLSVRSLQRLFSEYVGVGPKWVIQRFRILDAAAAAHSGRPTNWAELAQELGFSDQAHLTRAFTHVVGTPPAAYQRDPGTA